MNQAVIEMLSCPVCRAGMRGDAEGRVCRCDGARSHCFDFARSGYLNLGGPRAGEGDLKEAVQARRAFLDAGYYEALSDEINSVLNGLSVKTVLDAGCGEGYYTNRMADGRDVLGVDLSRAGIDAAAKRAKALQSRAGFCVGSIFELPVREGAVDAVVNIFAPCAEAEFSRVLKDGGFLLVVAAGERHLMGLKEKLYDTAHENLGRADLPQAMTPVDKRRVYRKITVEGRDMIEALFSMTPYYWRTSRADREKLASLDTLTTEIDFDLLLFRKDA